MSKVWPNFCSFKVCYWSFIQHINCQITSNEIFNSKKQVAKNPLLNCIFTYEWLWFEVNCVYVILFCATMPLVYVYTASTHVCVLSTGRHLFPIITILGFRQIWIVAYRVKYQIVYCITNTAYTIRHYIHILKPYSAGYWFVFLVLY